MSDIAVGLAGVGYWGSKLARNIFDVDGCRLKAICDPEESHREAAVNRYPGSRPIADLAEFVSADDVDAIVLATPASLHFQHARAALEAGKHVLVEKPLALSSVECDELCELAAAKGVTLMVGHTFVYSEPVRMLRRLIQEGELGQILYVYGQRVNLGVIREDLNALWNFGPHDVSILLYLLDSLPLRVSAHQFSVLNRSLEDIAFVVLEFPGGVIGHIHDSWLDPRKVRQFTVVGDQKMAVYDDTNVESPVQIYDKGVMPLPFDPGSGAVGELFSETSEGFGEFKLRIRAGDILAPRVEPREPLRVEIEHFIDCLRTGATPLTDGRHGREVVAVLEAAERSARYNGAAHAVEQRAAVVG